VNKLLSSGRSSAWPVQGTLPSIPASSALRGQLPIVPALPVIPPKTFTAVPIKPDLQDLAAKSKTPSPQKPVIRVEHATGKENVNITPQSVH
jgi:hypothetical protein